MFFRSSLPLSSPGIPDDHPESYHTYMWQNFFQHIDIDPVNVHILDGNATDLQKECDEYEQKIKDAGGIHLFIGGGCTISLSVCLSLSLSLSLSN